VDSLARVARDVVGCERCRRLRDYCREVARIKVKRFRSEEYWGRPVPGMGDRRARLLVVGLAPAAHGGNRTGRVFTGDRSGDFLFDALFRAGFSSSPLSISRGDGLALKDCYIAPLVRCAPPANRPTPAEIATCREYFVREWSLLPDVRAVLALGHVAMTGFLATLRSLRPDTPRYPFGHGLAHDLGGGVQLFTSYHPSQQNTFTGKLTPKSFDHVFAQINGFLGRSGPRRP
jgi:uracil-DNA glycosylase family 4